jgi:hypothetical protein
MEHASSLNLSPPPLPRRAAPRLGVSPLVVVLICLLLGMAMGWGWSGEIAASRMSHALDVTKTDLTFVQARQSDLASLLSDPQSQIIHFSAAASKSTATVVLIWNPSSGRGMLLCQELWPLPAGQKYRLSGADGVQGATELVSFTSARGVTAIPFHIPFTESFTHFTLSAGTANAPATQPLFTAVRS